MKQLLWFLVVLVLTASVASAGPNQGGVLWVHDTGIEFSSDLVLPPVSEPPADCAGVDNQQDADLVERIWKVYAAFPAGSSPRLKTVGWETQFPDAASSPTSYVSVTTGAPPDEDGPGTDFFIGDLGFPTASGGQIGQSFPSARTTTVVALFYFYGFGYNASGPLPTWSLVPKLIPLIDDNFGDDAGPPANIDRIMGYGSLGFGTPGTTPCPSGDPDAACCAPEGTCTVTKQAACASPSVWHGDWYACTPNPCPLPTGACCYSDGRCQPTQEQQCSAGGGAYQGNFVSCTPSPCPPAAACCLATGNCLVRIEAACVALNPPGTWHAESASCDPSPCSSLPTGSCCFPDGSCIVETETTCTAGVWTLSGTCMPNNCPAPEELRACCDLQRACTLTLQADCATPSQWHSEWSACDPNECLTLQGACCAPDGTCTLTTVSTCDPSMTWRGDLTTCDPNSCPLLPAESTSWGQIKNRFR